MPGLPRVGEDFAGYRLRRRIGRGGMGQVYKAEDPRLQRTVALKVLAPERVDNDDDRARFMNESHIASSLDHPNIIPIYDFGTSETGYLFIAMRYVPGPDLGKVLGDRGWLDPGTAVRLLSQTARALDFAHRRALVHRDVKPENLLIQPGGGGEPDHVYLADFGITKQTSGHTGLTAAGHVVGTLSYLAPEQIEELEVTGAADQYALGCVLFQCLTGRVPFAAGSEATIMRAHVKEDPPPAVRLRPELPPAINDVFARVLAKSPGARYGSCREFMAAADDALRPMASGMIEARSGTALKMRPPAPGPDQEIADDEGIGYALTNSTDLPFGGLSAPVDPAYLGAGIAADAVAAASGGPGASGGPRTPLLFGPGEPGAGSRPRRRRRRRKVRAVTTGSLVAGVAAVAAIVLALAHGTPREHPVAAQASVLMRTIENANANAPKAGQMNLGSCQQAGPDEVNCAWVTSSIANVTFLMFPTVNEMYNKYVENVANLARHGAMPGSHAYTWFKTEAMNRNGCGSTPPSQQRSGESAWSPTENTVMGYSSLQMATQPIDVARAEGRVFCYLASNGKADFYWTLGPSHVLVMASGATAWSAVWPWYLADHALFVLPPGASTPTAAPSGAASSPGGTVTSG